MSVEELQQISRLLSRDLHLAGKDAANTRSHLDATICGDYIMSTKMYRNGFEYNYSAGSMSEGTEVVSSDVDNMIAMDGIQVLNSHIRMERLEEGVYFVRDTSKCPPGYARLIPNRYNTSLQPSNSEYDFVNLLVEHEGVKYLSSEKFQKYVQQSTFFDEFPFGMQQHGPCLMTEVTSKYAGCKVDCDLAYALRCRQWPKEELNNLKRKRSSGWPSEKMIADMSAMRCHVVAVWETSALEWRQSFLLCERYLIWNFNDTQIQCYVTMKQLKNKHFEPLAPNQISSYHLKTVLFWKTEEEGLGYWTEENLLTCVYACLQRLAECVQTRNLRHYFIKGTNLFREKFRDPGQIYLVVKTIEDLKKDVTFYVLTSGLPTEVNLSKLYLESDGDVRKFIRNSWSECLLTKDYDQFLEYYHIIRKYRARLDVMTRHAYSFFGVQEKEAATKALIDAYPQIDSVQKDMGFFAKYIDIRKGLTHVVKSKTTQDKVIRDQMVTHAHRLLENGSTMDHVSGKLYLATYYLDRDNPEMCLSTVKAMLERLPPTLLYIGFCSKTLFVCFEDGTFRPKVKPQEGPDILAIAYDVILSNDDVTIAPPELVVSCAALPKYGDRCLVISPFVYTLYLLHCATRFLKGIDNKATKQTLDQLESFILKDSEKPLNYHAHNLLAGCFKRVGLLPKAFLHWKKSMQLLGGHHNAAVWELAVTLFSGFRSKV